MEREYDREKVIIIVAVVEHCRGVTTKTLKTGLTGAELAQECGAIAERHDNKWHQNSERCKKNYSLKVA